MYSILLNYRVATKHPKYHIPDIRNILTQPEMSQIPSIPVYNFFTKSYADFYASPLHC